MNLIDIEITVNSNSNSYNSYNSYDSSKDKVQNKIGS